MRRKNINNKDVYFKFSNKALIRTVLIVVLIALLSVSIAYAKFVDNSKRNAAIVAKDFYFTSDLLDGETHEISAVKDNETGEITVTLMNYEDELRFSDVDIEYNVSISPSEGVTLDKNSGKLTGGNAESSEIKISGLKSGTSYTVTASTNNIYKKTINGKINVRKLDNKVYASIVDKGEYINVTVWTKDYSEEVSLTYPEGLIPDNTDNAMMGWTTSESGSVDKSGIKLGPNSSHTFRFFKSNNDAKSYDVTKESADGFMVISGQ